MKLKKILAAAVSAAMAAGCMAYMPQADIFEQMTVEAAETGYSITLGSVIGLPGETVTVPINITGFSYDKNML